MNAPFQTDKTPNPPATCSAIDPATHIVMCEQDLIAGGGFAMARRLCLTTDTCYKTGSDAVMFVSLTNSIPAGIPTPTGMSAAQLAADAITRVQSTGLQTLEANHAQWWTDSFWSASITSVPDAIFESFHAMQMYKVGSATRCDSDDNCWAMDLAMPWYVLPAATAPLYPSSTLLLSLATALLLRPPFSPP